MAKRILCFVLTVLMVFPMFVACGNLNSEPNPADTTDSANASDTTTDNTAEDAGTTTDTDDDALLYNPIANWPQLEDNLPPADFDGETLRMHICVDALPMTYTSFEMGTDRISDAQFRSREIIQDRFTCKIVMEYTGPDTFVQYEDQGTNPNELVQQLIATGDDSIHLITGLDNWMRPLSIDGNFLDLAKLEPFDLSREWWLEGTHQYSICGVYYLGSSMLSYDGLWTTYPLVVNLDLMEDYNLEMPYDKVFAGEWYFDDMITLCTQVLDDVDGDGAYTWADTYGFVYSRNELYQMQTGMDLDFFEKNDKDEPIYVDRTERASIYMEKLHSLLSNPASYADVYWGITPFGYNRVLMINADLMRTIRDIIPTDVNYGFLPVPKLDEHQKDYIFAYIEHPWAIPRSAYKHGDFIATVIEALQCEHHNRVIPELLEVTLKSRIAERPEDSEILSMIPSRMQLTLGKAISESLNKLYNLASIGEPGQMASQIAKASKQAQNQVKALVKKVSRNQTD